jgi:hypothetical protein
MATVFRIRWFFTLSFLEVAVRVVVLSALFTRTVPRRAGR